MDFQTALKEEVANFKEWVVIKYHVPWHVLNDWTLRRAVREYVEEICR